LRSPQGKPVLVQAGASDDGRALAAATAEAIFAAHQSLADAQAFYSDIKARAAVLGRKPEHIKILPGVTIFTAPTSPRPTPNINACRTWFIRKSA
jgi:alkanesulfonate monooxygenase SsuD/methylene tetrahydromethanopterin reductase-like flavin-dependent oxidoreductase (luciferase family)